MRDGRCLVIGRRGRNTLRTMSAAINISSARVSCVTPFSPSTVKIAPFNLTMCPVNGVSSALPPFAFANPLEIA